MAETQALLKDVLYARMHRSGFVNWNYADGSEAPVTPAMRTMRILVEEFDNTYHEVFMQDVEVMGRPIITHESFIRVAETLFETGIHWGRIVGLFTFACGSAVNAMRSNRIDLIDEIVQWTTDYLTSPRLAAWINEHDGWDGFVTFFRHGGLANHNRMNANEEFRNGAHGHQHDILACYVGIFRNLISGNRDDNFFPFIGAMAALGAGTVTLLAGTAALIGLSTR